MFSHRLQHARIGVLIVATVIFFGMVSPVHAGIIDALKEKISNRTNEVKKLEEEIEEYQGHVKAVERQAQTLQGEINRLKSTQRDLQYQINVTDREIDTTTKSILRLTDEIAEKEASIIVHEDDLSETIRIVHELESRSLLEMILSGRTFSFFWDALENLGRFQANVQDGLGELQDLRNELRETKEELESEKDNLEAYEVRLVDKREIVKENTREQNKLLDDTKNQEESYKQLLADRVAQRDALEREIAEFEEQLRVEIDPDSLPATGTGILQWPLRHVRITQYFGNTPFASRNAQVYNGRGHNGIDFGAPTGTELLASANGVVVDTGNTDEQCYGASFGKWVLIRHYNGLSTLYAHLSLIKTVAGQEVTQGDIIGYSGNTGYSTGPHLHFAVYASKAVNVTDQYKSRVCGTYMKLPLSAKNGYLNPLSYLPQ